MLGVVFKPIVKDFQKIIEKNRNTLGQKKFLGEKHSQRLPAYLAVKHDSGNVDEQKRPPKNAEFQKDVNPIPICLPIIGFFFPFFWLVWWQEMGRSFSDSKKVWARCLSKDISRRDDCNSHWSCVCKIYTVNRNFINLLNLQKILIKFPVCNG